MARGDGAKGALAVVVVASLVAPAVATGSPGPTAGNGTVESPGNATVEQTVTLSLTPDRPGSIAATASYDVPASVTALSVSLPANATVTAADGFARNGTGYRWDGDAATPTLSFRVPANRSGVRHHGVDAAGYAFADAGDWALVRTPAVRARWWWDGADSVALTSRVAVAGSGVATDALAYLGPHHTYRRAVGDHTVRLVVPAAASVDAGHAAVLAALADAARALRVGDRGDATVVAAPTSVPWAVDGVQLGASGAWVAADQPLDSPDDVWTHEYVHTRQKYRLAPAMAWFAEASAEYYAAALAVADGRVAYDAFRRHVTPPGSGAALADPAARTAATVYRKGPVVLAALDARVHAATGGRRSLVDVSRRLNRHDGVVTLPAFLDAVGAVAGPEVRGFAERAVTRNATPALPAEPAFEVDAGNASA